ncbi:hypothetical protein [Labilithrix luteola]|uniref:hypothetical protein n=1 Tax=Labilithrix luteola TaxID=1391654 RepID=UPI0011BA821D|nr:hypothetical protein [Labilithrix luteola]
MVGLVGSALASASCTERSDHRAVKSVTAPVASVDVPRSPEDAAAPSAPDTAASRGANVDPEQVGFMRDGTVIALSDREVVSIDPRGAIQRKALAKGERATIPLHGSGQGVVVEDKEHVTLLDVPSLKPLFTGKGRPVTSSSGDGILLDNPTPGVVVKVGDKLLHLEPKTDSALRHVEDFTMTSSRAFGIVTWGLDRDDNGPLYEGEVFSLSTGQRIGKAVGMQPYSMQPAAFLDDKFQYGIAGDEIRIVDLGTGKITRRKQMYCGKDQILANPIPSPDGAFLLVTCADDLMVLDGASLGLRRRITRVMPGCDNGMILPAHFDELNKRELVVEGCGGESRLDVSTGKYRCGDSEGVLGAPYEMGFGVGSPPRAPGERAHLPRCTPEERTSAMPLGNTGKYHWGIEEAAQVVGPRKTISLEEGASIPSFSADDTKMVYLHKGSVIVRALPEGTKVFELPHSP